MKKERFSRSLFGLDKRQIDKHLQMLKTDYEQKIREKEEEIEELRSQVQAYRDIETDIFEKREEIIQAMLRAQKEAKLIQLESQQRLVAENEKLENIRIQIANCQEEAINTMRKYIDNITNFDGISENLMKPSEIVVKDAIDNVKDNVFFEKISAEEIIQEAKVERVYSTKAETTHIEDLYENKDYSAMDEIAMYKEEQELINMFELVNDIDEEERPKKLPKHTKKTPTKSKMKTSTKTSVKTKTTTKATETEKSTRGKGRPKKSIAV